MDVDATNVVHSTNGCAHDRSGASASTFFTWASQACFGAFFNAAQSAPTPPGAWSSSSSSTCNSHSTPAARARGTAHATLTAWRSICTK